MIVKDNIKRNERNTDSKKMGLPHMGNKPKVMPNAIENERSFGSRPL